MSRAARTLALGGGALAILLGGCAEHRGGETFVEVPFRPDAVDVDLLVVMDDSNSMSEEQAVFGRDVERLVTELVSPSPDDRGERPEAVRSLRLGVVTTDMGVGGWPIMTCDDPVDGDAGELQDAGRLDGCAERYRAPGCPFEGGCPWLERSPEAPDEGTDPGDPPIWEDLACIATLGTGGCGFEQQLEAGLAALTVQAAPGRRNEGFLRDDSVLAVLFVTDEDDCSAADGALFDPSRDDLGPLCVRCVLGEDVLVHPVDRYVDGFRALRPGREELVLAAAIVGVPIDLRPDSDWLAWAARVRAVPWIDPANPTSLLPSCNTVNGLAFPPPRIVEVAARLGGPVRSICASDWTESFEALAAAIQARLATGCAAEPVGDGCRLVATLERADPCPPVLVDLGPGEGGGRRCEVPPADRTCAVCALGAARCEPEVAGCEPGFAIDPSAPACPGGRVMLARPDLLPPGSTMRLECPAG